MVSLASCINAPNLDRSLTYRKASYQMKNGWWHVQKYAFCKRKMEPLEPFYQGAETLNT